ncbi:sulfur carrier protein ThiS [Methylocystis bryophila]|uniref:Thiamine biosynthesis protein ThiS n=1 Tax=Methylocystis bryophila TaxID=655015 RepID=A0A1W6MSN7_9HYPH|nr:sulfur carrier protein ThiS [Methylocystis bryophila]ARN80572.1 thiamine biosynthesis protein ThiS [Methylocystis bryophila]BDV40622.1 thiamine biosynthesis protein ThiS [Methylocystis bryophila]
MNIRINGEMRTVAAVTLEALLAELDYGDGPYATALNREFVRKDARAQTRLKEGDCVEIVSPKQGG